MVTTYFVFQCAERIEMLWSEIYGALARQFQGDSEASALFRQLEGEELQHANQIRLMASHYRHDRSPFRRAAIADHEFESLIADGKVLLRSILAGEWNSGLPVVKQRIAEMEARFSAAHARVLAEGADPAILGFFEKLAAQDQEHRRLLLA